MVLREYRITAGAMGLYLFQTWYFLRQIKIGDCIKCFASDNKLCCFWVVALKVKYCSSSHEDIVYLLTSPECCVFCATFLLTNDLYFCVFLMLLAKPCDVSTVLAFLLVLFTVLTVFVNTKLSLPARFERGWLLLLSLCCSSLYGLA